MRLTSLLTVAMAAVAALIAVPGVLAEPEAAVPDLTWLALLPLFAAAEIVVVHLPTRRNAHGHTLREIPAVLGLTFLAPQQYVSAYVLGAVLALVLVARLRGEKLAFNAAMFALEAALGALVYHAILQDGDPLSPMGWLAVLVAVLLTDLFSAAAVTTAISVTERAFDGEVLHEALRWGTTAAFINTCVALVFSTLAIVQPSALALLAVVVVLLAVGYREYIVLHRGHARTQLLYRFVDRTSSAASSEEIVEIVVREAAALMQADRAYLVEVLDERHVTCHSLVDDTLLTQSLELGTEPPWWWRAVDEGGVQKAPVRPGAPEGAAATGEPTLTARPRDGLAARLRGGDSTRYVLVVCDRSFEVETFGPEDVQVFEALAAHAGVAAERARGVSALEALAEQLKTARDAALAASSAKSMFLANMSHEIRTPLTTVLAAGEMLEDTELDTVQRNLLERLQRSGDLLLTLVESLLDFSRLDAGHTTLQEEELDLPRAVHDVVDAAQPRARRQGLDLDCVVDPATPRTVTGDRTRIVQVLGNLVDNALKFTPHGSVHVDLRPWPDGEGGGQGVQLTVSDTGIGIDPADHAAIFDAFRQVDGSSTRQYAGTGLGLAICKQLTELMGGSIQVSGSLGAGSTFTVRLPLTEVAPTAAEPAEAPAVGPAGDRALS